VLYISDYASPIGKIILGEENGALKGAWFAGQRFFFSPYGEKTEAENRRTEVLKQASDWLDRYFGGKRPEIKELLLAPEGSEFRRLIWSFLREIPYGQTVTYKSLAERAAEAAGKPKTAAQAVGGAVGHNPIGIIIPCHRVIGADGSLTGYGGGIERKKFLLRLETGRQW